MKSINEETRKRAINAVLTGKLSAKDAACVFEVHRSTICKWIQVYKQEGRIKPNKCGGRKATFIEEHEILVHQFINEQPDITLKELVNKLDNIVQKSVLQKHLVRLGYDYKKNSESKGTRARRHKSC